MILVSANGFINAPQEDKYKLIESAIKREEQYEFTRNCLLAMLEHQREEAKNANDAFIYDNLSQVDFEDERL